MSNEGIINIVNKLKITNDFLNINNSVLVALYLSIAPFSLTVIAVIATVA
jgi:hypothetical protein